VKEDFSEMTVLLVDDEDDIRSIIADLLLEIGVKILEAGNGREALEIIHKNKIDMAIIDIMMPEMNGIELLTKLQESHPELICMMLTAHGSKDLVISALRANAYDFLEKPFNKEMLINRVKNGLKMRYFQKYLDASINGFFEERRSPSVNDSQKEISEKKTK